MILSKPYQLTAKEYFRLALKSKLIKVWWLYAIIFVLAILNLLSDDSSIRATGYFLIIFGCIWPVVSIFILRYRIFSKDNDNLFLERTLSFNEDHFFITDASGTENKIPYSRIIKVKESKTFWLLYLAKYNFIYVPKHIFFDEAERKQFVKYIKTPKKN